MSNVMRCMKPFVCAVDGQRRSMSPGDLVWSKDPVVKVRPDYFVDVEEFVSKNSRVSEPKAAPAVERATAEPGEKRAVGRPRKTPKTDELTPENAPKTAAEAEAAGVKLDEEK